MNVLSRHPLICAMVESCTATASPAFGNVPLDVRAIDQTLASG